jgi:hypothetical protein
MFQLVWFCFFAVQKKQTDESLNDGNMIIVIQKQGDRFKASLRERNCRSDEIYKVLSKLIRLTLILPVEIL